MTKLQSFAYWGAFAIPVILLFLGAVIQKIVDNCSFRRDHFYLGIDMTIYCFAATLVNFLDIAKSSNPDQMEIAWTVVLILACVIMLFCQIGMQQTWSGQHNKGGVQKFMLCYFANSLGILLLYMFVILKRGGTI